MNDRRVMICYDGLFDEPMKSSKDGLTIDSKKKKKKNKLQIKVQTNGSLKNVTKITAS